MVKVNYNKIFKPSNSKARFSRPEGAGNFDNMDDVNIVQSTSLRQGTVEHTPINSKDIVNKQYVDDAIGTIITLTPITDPAYAAGQLWYSADTDTLSFHNSEADITLQIGEELWTSVRNNTGSTINDFVPVYQTGAIGKRPTIALGQANNATTAKLIGITTHQIENNTNGFITIEGIINGVNTSGAPFSETWNEGDVIYLCPDAAGCKTNIRPTGADEFVIELGRVLTANPATGSFLVKGLQSTNILDEDNMATNSSTQAPSQQSTKAYVDAVTASGATGTFTTVDAKTVTVTNGIITNIV